jgi:hypothetical protein
LRHANRALQSLRPSSPESQPDASGLRGGDANSFVSECPHFEHSNARLSKPSGSSETDIVVIRIWQLDSAGAGSAIILDRVFAWHSPLIRRERYTFSFTDVAQDLAVIRNPISGVAIPSVGFPTINPD